MKKRPAARGSSPTKSSAYGPKRDFGRDRSGKGPDKGPGKGPKAHRGGERTTAPEDRKPRTTRPEGGESFKSHGKNGQAQSWSAAGAKRPDREKRPLASQPKGPSRPDSSRPAPRAPRPPASRAPLVWGLHAVREAWLNPARVCHRLYVTEAGLAAMEGTLAHEKAKSLRRPAPALFEKGDIEGMLPRGSVHQGVVLEADALPEMTLDDLLGRQEEPARLVVVLDQVTDPHNVGAILRSAAAFGADAVIVTERNAPQATGVLAKAACGALEHVPVIAVVNLARALEALQRESFWCVGLAEEGGKDLSAIALSGSKVALVLGAEGEGLRRLTRQHCDELARLPTGGAIGSLNVSNAAAVALYEARRQRAGA